MYRRDREFERARRRRVGGVPLPGCVPDFRLQSDLSRDPRSSPAGRPFDAPPPEGSAVFLVSLIHFLASSSVFFNRLLVSRRSSVVESVTVDAATNVKGRLVCCVFVIPCLLLLSFLG